MQAKVLVVDDDLDLLDAMARRLGQGYDVRCAGCGIEALEILESEGPFAVVVSDLKMPGIDGEQFLGEVMRQAPETVRILLTGHGAGELAVDAVNKGHIFRYLGKPYAIEDLRDSIAAGVEHFSHRCLAQGAPTT